MSSKSTAQRRWRARRALCDEFRLPRFADLPEDVQAAADALLLARDAEREAARGSDAETRSRTSNTAARRSRELSALLAGDEKATGALVDRYSDAEFIALSRGAYLKQPAEVAELDRLCLDDAAAVMRRTLAGPPWWEIAPELREDKKTQAVAVEASEPLAGDRNSEDTDASEPDDEDGWEETLAEIESDDPPLPEPPPPPKRTRPVRTPPDPTAWLSEKSRSRSNGLPDRS